MANKPKGKADLKVLCGHAPRRQLIDLGKRNSRNLTVHEAILANALHERYGDLFAKQWVISEFIIDFYSPILAIAIEVDGKTHTRSRVRARDELQEAAVERQRGVTVRCTNEEVRETLSVVLERIHGVVLSRAHLRGNENVNRLHGYRLPRKLRKVFIEERAALGM